MGLFNYVDYEVACPKCGAPVSGFQTKDGDCCMDTVKPHQVSNFYSSCDKCGFWVEYKEVENPDKKFELVVKNDNL